MTQPLYVKKIDNYNFIAHIVAVKCIHCGEFFEPDKTKPIEPVCGGCVNIPESVIPKPKHQIPDVRKRRKYVLSEKSKNVKAEYQRRYRLKPEVMERNRMYMREYMRKYYKRMKQEKP